jgi:preprotein translocase subunit SecE
MKNFIVLTFALIFSVILYIIDWSKSDKLLEY